MCDTIVAPPSNSAGGKMLFGKNSDRQRNEAEVVEFFPAASHAAGAAVKCTYISIPQAARTHAVLICRPFWMWGAEMGANEHGLVIGNEAVHARNPAQQEPALLGDDLVRLALERATTAAEGVDVITSLLEQYGQGGNNGHLTPSFFNNGFMIADAREAFVLETIGREWLLERVTGVRSMSNRYSIAKNVARTSRGLNEVLRGFGWEEGVPEDYSGVIANPNREHIGFASARRACTTSLLQARDGELSVADMMRILRDHGSGETPHPHWADDAYVRRSVCMHAGGIDSTGQTTGTMVSELTAQHALHWVTGTSAPCTSVFKPIFLDAMPARNDLRPTDRFDPATLWWRHEQIHRAAIAGNFKQFLDDVRDERDALEAQFIARVAAVVDGSTADRASVVAQCWQEADALETKWLAQRDRWVSSADSPQREGWARMNEVAGMTPAGSAA
jgi:secernin